MKKNLKGCVDLITVGEPQILVDMNQYDMIDGAGLTPDSIHRKSAHMTACWRFAEQTRAILPISGTELSACRYLTFSVFATAGVGGSFSLMLDNSESGDGKNGYEQTLPLTRDGWNHYRVELPFMRAVGEPLGWEGVQSVCFDCVAGGQANRAETVLYLDNLFGWEDAAPPLYLSAPELKGAAVFSRTGNFSIVDRKRIANTPDGSDAKPFEKDGILWIPMAPVAAGIAHAAVVDTLVPSLSFTYRRKKYVFTGGSDRVRVGDVEESLNFYPAVVGGTLFFPSEYVRTFFHWRQCFVDPMGLIVLSNRKSIFESARDEALIWQLISDATFVRPDADRVLNDLHRRFPNPGRGRLLASFDELMQLRRDAKTDAGLKSYVELLKTRYGVKSDGFAAEPSAMTDAASLELTAEAILSFSMLYRVTGDKAYAERVAAECELLASVEDWSGGTLSTVGAVALAVAIGYDWCHHVWSEGRKATVERALLRNAMRPMLETYDGKRRMWRAGSVTGAVVNAGMLATALALADVYPQTAYKLIDRIFRNVEPCFVAYAPDGGYPEGVAAWERSCRALALLVAMLEKACGTDYGFTSAPGFLTSAYFPIHAETANGAWNYHNCAAESVDTSILPWFSKRTGDPVPAWMRRQQILSGRKAVHPFDILFYTPIDTELTPYLPLDAVSRRAGLAMMRAGWERDSAFVGLHGGRNHEVGGDLDAGSVILDMGGERFFLETGGDARLSLMTRRRAAGQNTLVVDPAAEPVPDQNPDAIAPLTEMRSAPERAYAVVDMTATNDAILRGKRGVMLTENRSVAVIQDELTLAHEAEVVWTVWTRAEVKLNQSGRAAKLLQNGKTLACKLCGVGSPARFSVEPVEGTDLCRLVVRLSAKEKVRMAVVCRLIGDNESPAQKVYDVVPMSKWGEIGG